MPESESKQVIEIYSVNGGSITTIRSRVRKSILHYIAENSEVSFSDINKYTGLSKSTISIYINSLIDADLIEERISAEDGRKKIYVLSSSYVGRIDPNSRINVDDFRKIVKGTETPCRNKLNCRDVLPHIIRVALAETGIRIDPIIIRGGEILGEAVADNLVGSNLEETITNVINFWKEERFGNMVVTSYDPVILEVYDCYECRIMPSTSSGGCLISKGILSAIFSKYYKKKICVNEIACMAEGSDCCRFVLKD